MGTKVYYKRHGSAVAYENIRFSSLFVDVFAGLSADGSGSNWSNCSLRQEDWEGKYNI